VAAKPIEGCREVLEGIAIVGVGLIGGSVGLAARSRKLAKRVIGIGRSAEKLAEAVRLGAIDEVSLELSAVADCDLIVVCTPVGRIANDIRSCAANAKAGTLIIDAGSTKADLASEFEIGLDEIGFVGCHPLAGSHKNGVSAARADLFENRLTIVTPLALTLPVYTDRAKEFWRSLGSRVVEMDPVEHDKILAMTSHLPHLLAAAMAISTPKEWLAYSAGGWRDQTRIAAGEPDNWTQIFLANREMLLKSLNIAQQNIAALRAAIESNDSTALRKLLAQGKEHRDALGD
jgi:prephenate dehydrogenase